ncbi:MAG: heavy metal-binding domain-containing protein [bacterium]
MRPARALGLTLAALSLVAVATWWIAPVARRDPPRAAATERLATYQCSMHPQVVAAEPGSCPICGMTLTRVAQDENEHVPAPPAPGGAAADDHASFSLAPAREQVIGVRTATVEFRELHRTLHTGGKVAFDPDLYAALADYRDARDARDALTATQTAEDRQRADALLRSASVRLRLLGLSIGQLEALARAGSDPTAMLLPGQGAWVNADLHAPLVDLPRPGLPVVVTSPSAPGRAFRGQLVTVDTLATGLARGLRVRAQVATPGGGLIDETIVQLAIEVPLGRRLALPEGALLDTGRRRLVFVRHADGRFEPRDVVVGQEGEDYDEVLAGLAPGERVVTSANFLIDSESRFRAALAAFDPRADERPAAVDAARADAAR